MDPRDKVRNTKSSDCLIKIRNDKEKIQFHLFKNDYLISNKFQKMHWQNYFNPSTISFKESIKFLTKA